ncbi:MAG: hypothetical protein ACOCQG_03820 [Candidatus Nanoarchaeia archaeon]
MKFKSIMILVLFLIALQPVLGDLSTDVEVHENKIYQGQEAEFTLEITNEADEAKEVQLYFPQKSGWSYIASPMITQREVEAGETIYTDVRILPVEKRLLPKKYNHPFRITDTKTGEIAQGSFQVYLRSGGITEEYVPVINVNVDLPDEIKPTENAKLDITLANQNYLNISEYVLNIKSEKAPENNEELRIPLKPMETRQESIELQYPDTMSPQTDTITVEKSIPGRNRTYDTTTKELKILGYTDVKEERKTKDSFLKSYTTINLTNSGNAEAVEEITLASGLFSYFFTTTNPEYNIEKVDGYRYLAWELQINPGETKNIDVTVNYRPLFIIIILLIIGTAIYYFERSPVAIKKEIKKIPGKEGETSRIKILLHLKNRTAKPQENITIIDKIPKIAKMETSSTLGTMQPSKVINNEKKGTIIKWDIPILEAHEERIISYQIYSKLEIVGSVSLDKAQAKFKNRRGKTSRTYSNQIKAT